MLSHAVAYCNQGRIAVCEGGLQEPPVSQRVWQLLHSVARHKSSLTVLLRHVVAHCTQAHAIITAMAGYSSHQVSQSRCGMLWHAVAHCNKAQAIVSMVACCGNLLVLQCSSGMLSHAAG